MTHGRRRKALQSERKLLFVVSCSLLTVRPIESAAIGASQQKRRRETIERRYRRYLRPGWRNEQLTHAHDQPAVRALILRQWGNREGRGCLPRQLVRPNTAENI